MYMEELIIILIQLFNLQIVNGAEYREDSNTRLTREATIEAARGSILDRSGNVLVSTEMKFSLSNVNKLPYGFELRWRKNKNNIEVYMCSNIDNKISLYDLIKSESLTNSQSC